MCHASPAAEILGLTVTALGACFIAWHVWKFDKGRCLLPTRRNIFRCAILWLCFAAFICFLFWGAVMVHVKYRLGYAAVTIGTTTDIMPTPYLTWSQSTQSLVRASYHAQSFGWGFLSAIHAEETLYWYYLIQTIRRRQNTSWFRSVQCKIWLVLSMIIIPLIPVIGFIYQSDLLEMEIHIFFAGSIFACVLFLGSIWLLVVFPKFIQEARRLGANPDVISRLQYFRELNAMRTVFRAMYCGSMLALSADGITKRHFLNRTPFWLDLLQTTAYSGYFISTGIGMMILLPRNTAAESGVEPSTAAVFVRPQFPRRRSDRPRKLSSEADLTDEKQQDYPSSPWNILGERLNLETGIADEGVALQSYNSSTEVVDIPFTPQPGARFVGRGQELSGAARVLDNFRSPIELDTTQGPADLHIVVVTNTVVEKD